MSPEPSAPPQFDVLQDDVFDYNSEQGCDVKFLVGDDPDHTVRIPVHSFKLQEYPYFRAMLSNNNFQEGRKENLDGGEMIQIPVQDIDPKAFDNMMKFIYGKPLNLQSQTSDMIVETLKAAHKYLLPQLVRVCVKHLSGLISLQNVLWIYASVKYLCNDLNDIEKWINLEMHHKTVPKRRRHSFYVNLGECTNPSNPSLGQDDLAGLEIKTLCAWLLGQTLLFIDAHATKVLESAELDQLDKQHLEFLLKRDSLNVTEPVVFSALIRWAENQCKLRHRTLTPQSKREVLEDLIYQVRFFCMTDWEFFAGPETSGLLTPLENEIIKNMIVHGRPYFNLENSDQKSFPELEILLGHTAKMGRARFRKTNEPPGTGVAKKRKWNSGSDSGIGGERKNSFKFKKVGGLVKNFCFPEKNGKEEKRRWSDSKVNYTTDDNNANPSPSPGPGGKKRKSALSKVIYGSIYVFAFLFD